MMDVQYSAVATVYNDADAVVQLLDEVCNQKVKPSEFIIADGGSKDSTVDIIQEYAKKTPVPIRILSGKRLNISQGLNAGISSSRYEWILIVAVGNYYKMEFAQHLLDAAIDKDLDIAYSLIQGMECSEFACSYNAVYGYNKGTDQGVASNHGVLVKKDVFRMIGLFYEHFYYAGEDAEFFERAKRHSFRICPVESAIAYWEVPSSMQEFKRQLKVYAIAQIQYFSLLRIIRAIAHNFKLWFRMKIVSLSDKSNEDRIARLKYFSTAVYMIRYFTFLFPGKRFDVKKIRFLE